MEKLNRLLSENPLVVFFMFLLSLLSALMTIWLGWNEFYNKFLALSIKLPIWIVLGFVILNLIILGVRRTQTLEEKTIKELKVLEGKIYGVQQIVVDGKAFKRCEFNGTELIIEGKSGFAFETNKFNGQHFTFAGPASMTITILSEMYKDPSFRPLVDDVLISIRNGGLKKAIPIQK